MGEEIRRTDWYSNSVNKIYMQLRELSTHTFALKRGDMAKLRKLLTEVVDKAETPQQKRRAKIIMTFFELSESAVQMLFSEIIPPDGKLTSSADALELLKQIPAAFDAKKRFEGNPYWTFTKKKLEGAMLANIGKVVPFLDDAEVRSELKILKKNPKLPSTLRRMIRIWQGAAVPNLIANGSFELTDPLPGPRRGNRWEASRGNQSAQDGKYVFGAVGSLKAEFNIPVKQGKTYLLIFSAFSPQGSAEGRLNYMLTPRRGKSNSDHVRHLNLTLTGGSWQTFTAAVTISNSRKVDNMLVNIWTANFEKNEQIWIDNVRVYCLDELNLED